MLESDKWEKRYFGFDLLKHLVYGCRRDKEYSDIYKFIKKGLLDKDGRVRNNAYYTLRNYRGFDILENSGHYAFMFFDLYKEFKKCKDNKIKKTFARSILEVNCPLFYEVMKESDYDEYCNAIDEAKKLLGIKSNYEIEWVFVNG